MAAAFEGIRIDYIVKFGAVNTIGISRICGCIKLQPDLHGSVFELQVFDADQSVYFTGGSAGQLIAFAFSLEAPVRKIAVGVFRGVNSSAAVQQIVACATGQVVIACGTAQRVASLSTNQPVVARITGDVVVSGQSVVVAAVQRCNGKSVISLCCLL